MVPKPDHSDLEAVQSHDAPEVVDNGMFQPEVSPYANVEEKYILHGIRVDSGLQPHNQREEPSFEEARHAEDRSNERRYCCGLSRRSLICLVVAISLLVVGTILGGVLGTHFSKGTSVAPNPLPNSPGSSASFFKTAPNTGLAFAPSASDPNVLFTYVMDGGGRICELSYTSSRWSTSRADANASTTVTNLAKPGSPLAAVSYPRNGVHFRQIFFVSMEGAIMTASSSSTGKAAASWNEPVQITNGTDTVVPNSVGLGACWGPPPMNGIRVFLPSQNGDMRELMYAFDRQYWEEAPAPFAGVNPASGVACSVYTSDIHQYISVYSRSASPGDIREVAHDYKAEDDKWHDHGTPDSWTNGSMASMALGSDVAVASDDNDTQYVYYRLENGQTARSTMDPSLFTYGDSYTSSLGTASTSKFAAASIGGGAMLLYQAIGSPNEVITLDSEALDGSMDTKGFIPG